MNLYNLNYNLDFQHISQDYNMFILQNSIELSTSSWSIRPYLKFGIHRKYNKNFIENSSWYQEQNYKNWIKSIFLWLT